MRMPLLHLAAASVWATTAVLAQPAPEPDLAAGQRLREAAIDNLLSERGPLETFNKLVDASRLSGVNEQAILEARFLYHVDQADDRAVAALLPDFLRQNEQFKLEQSAIFAIKEDWLAVIEYVKAIDAILKDDKAGFKTHITEAFWLSPRQAAAFAPQIERLRHDEAMKAITLDFATELSHLDGETKSTLKSLIAGKKALLLHFWSPESPECVMSLPDFATTSNLLSKHGIAIVSLTPQANPLARSLSRTYAAKPEHGIWVADSKEQPIAATLLIQQVPAMSLVSPEGRILFSGDPADDQFWKALAGIDPEIKRPSSEGDYNQ